MEKKEMQDAIESAYTTGAKEALELCSKMIDEKIGTAMGFGAKLGAQAAAEVAAKEAAKAVERERKAARNRQVDKRLHNTKVLFRNYRKMKLYCTEAIYEKFSDVEEYESFMEIMELMTGQPTDEQLLLESVERSVMRTQAMMAHVDRMLGIYQGLCERSGRKEDGRRWRVLRGMYLDGEPVTASELAEREYVEKRTVYRDVDAATEDMAVLLFGIDGIRAR